MTENTELTDNMTDQQVQAFTNQVQYFEQFCPPSLSSYPFLSHFVVGLRQRKRQIVRAGLVKAGKWRNRGRVPGAEDVSETKK